MPDQALAFLSSEFPIEDVELLHELDCISDDESGDSRLYAEYLEPSRLTSKACAQTLPQSLRRSIRAKYAAACSTSSRARSSKPPSLQLHIHACDTIAAALRFKDGPTAQALTSAEWSALLALAEGTMAAAERLKGQPPPTHPTVPPATHLPAMPTISTPYTASGAGAAAAPAPPAVLSLPPLGRLTHAEQGVLGRSSTINGRQYLPWCPEVDPGDAALFPAEWDPSTAGRGDKGLFNDPHGLMALSPSQRKHFSGWMRLSQIVKRTSARSAVPVVVGRLGVDADRVRQESVPDCSVIASLCIAARYEQTHKSRLVSGVIYPQDASGRPVYNPYGRYLVRMFFNGCFRRVEIDDLLPVDKAGRPLCAHSSDPTEFWPALLEKAYLKMCNGGYDFPGSNSSIDMHAFTGWLPERFDLRDAQALQEGRVWQRLQSAMASGDCLATVGTGVMAAGDEERTGLVSGHAYAVLSVHEVPPDPSSGAQPSQGAPTKLLRLKNPWARSVWKGRFSPSDAGSWTPRLVGLLGTGAGTQHKDDGTFFIDFYALCHAFKSLYMAWSPQLFAHRQVVHGHWAAGGPGPVDDRYNIGHNPQFLLDVQVPARKPGYKSALWLLLTRHVTQRDPEDEEAAGVPGGPDAQLPQARDGTPYLSLQLHGEASFKEQQVVLPGPAAHTTHSQWLSRSRRVFLAGPAAASTAYSPNPHILLRHDLGPGSNRLTVVVSQLKRTQGVDFTLRAWCLDPVSLQLSPGGLDAKRTLHGQWSTGNTQSNRLQHLVKIFVPCSCSVFLELQAAKEDAVQFELRRMPQAMTTSQTSATSEVRPENPSALAPAETVPGQIDGGTPPAAATADSSPPRVPPPADEAQQHLLCSSGAWRRCYTAKSTLGLGAGEYEVRLQCLPGQQGAAHPFAFSCSMFRHSAAPKFLVEGCSLDSMD